MKSRLLTITVMTMFLMIATNTIADPLKTMQEGCKVELEKYCSLVTPGDGRLLSCLFAHQDKLSNRCEYALYDGAVQLERAVAALTYVANECRKDFDKFCSGVAPGEGRLKECIDKNIEDVSDRCKSAMKDVGMK